MNFWSIKIINNKAQLIKEQIQIKMNKNQKPRKNMKKKSRNLYELLVNHNHKQGAMDQGPDINEIFHCSGCE